MARQQRSHMRLARPKPERETKGVAAERALATPRASGAWVFEAVNRMVSEVQYDELRLRERLRSLISGGQLEEALQLLAAWDEHSASEVLKLSERRERAS